LNLVVQGDGLTPQQASELGRFGTLERVSDHAVRLKGIAFDGSLGSWCEERQLDHAWMAEERRFADLKLLALDMDSTLITIECIDELGDMAGCKAEIAAITAQAMRGEIDYPESLRKRVGLLGGLEESVLERVYEERLRLSPGAEKLLYACKSAGVQLLLVSGGFTFFTDRLRDRLAFDFTASNVLEVEKNRLTGRLVGPIVDADAKAQAFLNSMKLLNATRDQTVAIGDGANDLKMMAEAGVSVAYRAKPVVRAQATCALNWSGLDGVLNLFD